MLTTMGISMGTLLIGVLIGIGACDDQWKEERDRRRRAESQLGVLSARRVTVARVPADPAAIDARRLARRVAADAHPMFRVGPGVHESLKAIRVAPREWATSDRRRLYGEEQHGGYIDVLLEHQVARVMDAWVTGELTPGARAARRLNLGLSGRSGVVRNGVAA